MEQIDNIPDYYTLLQCHRTASNEELKKSYQRLVLSTHPDKIDNDIESRRFFLIQKAWTVLRDPETRKQYDAELSCQEHDNLLLYDTIFLSDMELSTDEVYTFNCRCGGTYMLEVSNPMPAKVIIGCDECSFSIQVTL